MDGRRIRTPFAVTQGGARISSSGVYSVLNTDFGLVVKFDGVHHLEINIPGDYFGKVTHAVRLEPLLLFQEGF